MYECPLHKTTHEGLLRDTFEKEHFDALLLTSMDFSYKLYREVKHGCHCPSNYAALDRILKEFQESQRPKESPPSNQ